MPPGVCPSARTDPKRLEILDQIRRFDQLVIVNRSQGLHPRLELLMQIAQRLYESGQITHHRTAGAEVAPEAQEAAHTLPPAEMLRWGQGIRQRCSTDAADSDRAATGLLLQDFIATSEPLYPSAVACLPDDLVFATLWQVRERW